MCLDDVDTLSEDKHRRCERLDHGIGALCLRLLPWLCLYVLAGLPGSLQADVNPVRHLAVLADSDGTETIDTVARAGRESEFRDVSLGFSGGYNDTVYWLRFTLDPPPFTPHGAGEWLVRLRPSFVEHADLFIPERDDAGQASFRRLVGGSHQPHSERLYSARDLLFSVTFDDELPQTLYLRLETRTSAMAVLDALAPEQYFSSQRLDVLMIGLYIGLLLSYVSSILFHRVWALGKVYGSFIAYLVTALGLYLGNSGLVSELMFPEHPEWAWYWTVVVPYLCMAAATRFFYDILELKAERSWMRHFFRVTFWVTLLASAAPLLDWHTPSMNLIQPLVLIMLSLGVYRSFVLWQRRRGIYVLLLMANLLPLLGGIGTVAVLLGLLPGSMWILQGFQLGILGSLILLQLLLVRKARRLDAQAKESRAMANQATLQAHLEHQRLEEQQQFMSMLTHELKTPLSLIGLTLQGGASSERSRHLANQALQNVVAIIDRCAMASLMEEQTLVVKPVPCSLEAELDTLLVKLGDDAKRRCRLQIDSDAPFVMADPLFLNTVLVNLLDNALKYAPSLSPVSIDVQRAEESGKLGLAVTISNQAGSSGLPDPQRVFDKYYRSDGASRFSGSGLGLYIVHNLAGMMGGSVNIEIDNNRVSFLLWLPSLTFGTASA